MTIDPQQASRVRCRALAESDLDGLADLLARRLPQLRAVPGLAGRPLLVTSDHGLSFHRGALNHGAATVFELAVPRLMLPRAADVA